MVIWVKMCVLKNEHENHAFIRKVETEITGYFPENTSVCVFLQGALQYVGCW